MKKSYFLLQTLIFTCAISTFVTYVILKEKIIGCIILVIMAILKIIDYKIVQKQKNI